jgi:hypothetical protein
MKRKVYFLCSPSLGILDNWLPVINSMRSLEENLEFVLIFPKAETVRQINNESILINMSENIFDYVIYRLDSELWAQSNSLLELKDNIGPLDGLISFLIKLKLRLQKYKWLNYLMILIIRVYKLFDRYRYKSIFFDISSLSYSPSLLLYDLYEEGKPYNRDVLIHLSKSKKYSIYHGIGIDEFQRESRCDSIKSRENLKAYLFSSFEIDYYKRTFCLEDSHLSVVGIPRHDGNWLEKMHTAFNYNDFIFKKDEYVLIISRPLCSYITAERRKEALEYIKKIVIEKLGLKIVIKLHPKEDKSKIYEEVFGISEYEKKWVYSSRHPLALGENCKFAISFFSGVVIDMMKLGVPSIEYLDLKDLAGHDDKNSLRDGEYPIFGYRNLGFVYGASNFQQLEFNINKIINNRSVVNQELVEKYNKYFPLNNNVSNEIAKEMLLSL